MRHQLDHFRTGGGVAARGDEPAPEAVREPPALVDAEYMTLMQGFLSLSFLIMCATVVINLVVGKLDQAGRSEAGDRIDYRCRWIFPLTYFGLILVMVAMAFVFF